MTLRMVLQAADGEASLALHGWLTGPEVAEFERVAAEAPLPLHIDLTNLMGADLSGITALRAQRVRGAHLAKASPYMSILLDERDGKGASQPRRRGARRSTTRG